MEFMKSGDVSWPSRVAVMHGNVDDDTNGLDNAVV